VPDPVFAVAVVLVIAVVVALLAIRVGILLGAVLGRRIEGDDEEDSIGPAS
jgi:hypothetical protein